jgi:hypothetical protein
MPDLSQYVYDPRSRRYRDQVSGQFVTAKSVRFAVDTIIDAETVKVRDIAQRLIDGSINLAEWQIQTSSLLKTLHVAMGIAANGGFENTSNADLGFIGSLIKKQYEFLRNFAKQIKNGTQALDGTLLARAELYVQAGRGTYESVVARAARNGGSTQEKSILGAADHCGDCVGEAAKGWSPIGTLIPIGQRQCLSNCRCSMSYS